MTPTDPDSSPNYDPYELFKEELDLDQLMSDAPPKERLVASDDIRDEDRLYTDEFIRQNETASRVLFVSVIAAGVVSLGIGLWYLAQKPAAPPQPSAPLPVPQQPLVPPLPSLAPTLPTAPAVPLPSGQKLPPTDGIGPGNLPNSSPLPTAINPSGTLPTLPPPPPPAPSSSSR